MPMKTIKQLPFLFLFLFPFLGLTQTATLKGIITDTSNYKPMAYSAVILLKKDSSIYKKQFANTNGIFNFTLIKPDTYRVLISHPGFADYEEIIALQAEEIKDLGSVSLISKTNLLKEIIIKDRQAIKLKGDTVEFLVDSFLVNKNSNVEDLLKRLPGIQVDKDGKITAQGQEVKKVLVDGEEFFGNDPTIATKNIKADNVETVQVFDKKSEQTAFTGIDDGTKEKTINLTLKEEAKKGYFGKLNAAYGTPNPVDDPKLNNSGSGENRYESKVLLNKFSGKRKLALFSTISNTQNSDLDWDEREQYLGGNNIEYDEASGYMFSYFEGSEGDFEGNGIPTTRYVGAQYSDKLKNDKQIYNLTATHRNAIVIGAERDYSQWILPDTTYYNDVVTRTNRNRTNNTLNGKAEFKLDSLSSLIIKTNFSQSFYNNVSEVNADNLNEENSLVNRNNRVNTNEGDNTSLNYSLVLNKKFKTVGRTLSLKYDQRLTNNKRTSSLFSTTLFYNGDSSLNSEQQLDQLTPASEKGNALGASVTYTEPLGKKLFIVGSYDYHLTKNQSSVNTFNRDLNGIYNLRVDSLSNDLDYTIGIQKGELLLRFVNKKINTSIGAKISQTKLTQENKSLDTTLNQNFTNIFPSARLNYKISTTRSLNISYNGSTRQPTLQQINPIQNLSNPLVVFQGNQNLGQSFTNNINFSYNNYKPISGKSLWLNFNLNKTLNDFANFDEVDELGRRVFKTVNVDGNQSMSFYTYYFYKIPKLNLGVGNRFNGGIYKMSNFINGLSNENINSNLNYGLNLSYEKEEKFEVYLTPSIGYSRSTTSLRKDVVTNFFTYSINSSISFDLPKKFKWGIDCDWTKRAGVGAFVGNTNTIVNLNFSKRLLPWDQLEARITVVDLFNQNIGFERNANSNYVNEQNYLVLKRYLLFGITWNLNSNREEANNND
jgi:hypothetical protein